MDPGKASKSFMRILGVDPGSRITGYGIVDILGNRLHHVDNGIISTRSNLPLADRLQIIYDELKDAIEKHRPGCMGVEQVFLAKNPRAALTLGHARGAALLVGVHCHLAVHEYSALQVKSAVVGYGHASKKQVQQMVKALLNLPEIPQEDAADALAVAICHAHSNKLSNAIARSKGRR
jgi:crossover junction endodeoxyribonuclease RuvC